MTVLVSLFFDDADAVAAAEASVASPAAAAPAAAAAAVAVAVDGAAAANAVAAAAAAVVALFVVAIVAEASDTSDDDESRGDTRITTCFFFDAASLGIMATVGMTTSGVRQVKLLLPCLSRKSPLSNSGTSTRAEYWLCM